MRRAGQSAVRRPRVEGYNHPIPTNVQSVCACGLVQRAERSWLTHMDSCRDPSRCNMNLADASLGGQPL